MRKTTLIQVITPAVTPADARMRLRIDPVDLATDVQVDAELAAMIASASFMATTQTGVAIAHARYELEIEGGFPRPHSFGIDRITGFSDCNAIQLTYPTVKEVESITYTDCAGVTQTLAVGVDFRLSLGEFVRPLKCWPTDARDIKITYLAGFGDKTPQDVQHWLLLQVGHWYKNREAATEKALVKTPYGDRLLDGISLGPKV